MKISLKNNKLSPTQAKDSFNIRSIWFGLGKTIYPCSSNWVLPMKLPEESDYIFSFLCLSSYHKIHTIVMEIFGQCKDSGFVL